MSQEPEVGSNSPLVHRRSRILLLGYGNQYRGDDGIGPVLLQRVAAEVEKIPLQELTLDLAETLARYELVVFIDAAVSGDPVTWRELKADHRPSPLSHHLPPETLLFYAETLYQRAPRAFLLSVRGYSFDFGERLSPEAEGNVQAALAILEGWLQEQRGNLPS